MVIVKDKVITAHSHSSFTYHDEAEYSILDILNRLDGPEHK